MFSITPSVTFRVRRRAAADRATTPCARAVGMETRTKRAPGPRTSAYWSVRSAPGGRSTRRTSRRPQSTRPSNCWNRLNSRVARQTWESPRATLTKSRSSDFRHRGAHRYDAESGRCAGQRHAAGARKQGRVLQAGEARLAGPVQVGVEHGAAAAAALHCQGQLHGQGALADASLAGADGDDVLDPGQGLGDAFPLPADLADDVGTAVIDQVEVALHRGCESTKSSSRSGVVLIANRPGAGPEAVLLEAAGGPPKDGTRGRWSGRPARSAATARRGAQQRGDGRLAAEGEDLERSSGRSREKGQGTGPHRRGFGGAEPPRCPGRWRSRGPCGRSAQVADAPRCALPAAVELRDGLDLRLRSELGGGKRRRRGRRRGRRAGVSPAQE